MALSFTLLLKWKSLKSRLFTIFATSFYILLLHGIMFTFPLFGIHLCNLVIFLIFGASVSMDIPMLILPWEKGIIWNLVKGRILLVLICHKKFFGFTSNGSCEDFWRSTENQRKGINVWIMIFTLNAKIASSRTNESWWNICTRRKPRSRDLNFS